MTRSTTPRLLWQAERNKTTIGSVTFLTSSNVTSSTSLPFDRMPLSAMKANRLPVHIPH